MTDATTTETPSAAGCGATHKKHVVDLQEVQDTVSRLAAHKGVLAVLILNKSGDIVTQSGSGDGAVGNPKLLSKMLQAANTYVGSMHNNDDGDSRTSPAEKSSGIEGGDAVEGVEKLLAATKDAAEEDITFVRIRTPQNEVLVAPKSGYTLVVLQDPSISSL